MTDRPENERNPHRSAVLSKRGRAFRTLNDLSFLRYRMRVLMDQDHDEPDCVAVKSAMTALIDGACAQFTRPYLVARLEEAQDKRTRAALLLYFPELGATKEDAPAEGA